MSIAYQSQYIDPDIKLSYYEDRLFKDEVVFDHHMLVWFISGETKIIQANATQVFGPGDIFLIPRNQLATIINYPKDGLPHRSVVMHLTAARLGEFYAKTPVGGGTTPVTMTKTLVGGSRPYPSAIIGFGKHPLLESCLASLIPYFDLKQMLPARIASIKIEEAINILRIIDPAIDQLLANFEEPGKIDLVDFMEKNYMFNMTMDKFGYHTGRSLTTFKRDFKKAFDMTPQKWLTRKRLELAHYQIRERKRKPSDVYLEVGFENLSHFTHAFKTHFGYAPTKVGAISGERPLS